MPSQHVQAHHGPPMAQTIFRMAAHMMAQKVHNSSPLLTALLAIAALPSSSLGLVCCGLCMHSSKYGQLQCFVHGSEAQKQHKCCRCQLSICMHAHTSNAAENAQCQRSGLLRIRLVLLASCSWYHQGFLTRLLHERILCSSCMFGILQPQ